MDFRNLLNLNNVVGDMFKVNSMKINDTENESINKKNEIIAMSKQLVDIPKELYDGEICIGEVNDKDTYKKIYLNREYMGRYMNTVITGAMGSGKSTLLNNMAVDAIKAGVTTFYVDYSVNNYMSDILKEIGREKVEVIDFSNIKTIDCFSFPELDEISTNIKYNYRIKHSYICSAIRDMVWNRDEITKGQARCLKHACKLIFWEKGKGLLDLIKFLSDTEERKNVINRCIEKGVFESVDREVAYFNNENEVYSRSILDRLEIFYEDYMLSQMLNNSQSKYNFNEIVEDKKSIVLRIPKNIIQSDYIANLISVYYHHRFQHARHAYINRHAYEKTNEYIIFCDEINVLNKLFYCIKDSISERALKSSYVLTVHQISQLDYELRCLLEGYGYNHIATDVHEKKNLLRCGLLNNYDKIDDVNGIGGMRYTSLNLICNDLKYILFSAKLPEPFQFEYNKGI